MTEYTIKDNQRVAVPRKARCINVVVPAEVHDLYHESRRKLRLTGKDFVVEAILRLARQADYVFEEGAVIVALTEEDAILEDFTDIKNNRLDQPCDRLGSASPNP